MARSKANPYRADTQTFKSKRPTCGSCGYYYAYWGKHRDDCMASEEKRAALSLWDAKE